MINPRVIVINGLSASGKTSLLKEIKECVDCEIIASSSSLRKDKKRFCDDVASYEHNLIKQRYFLQLDKEKNGLVEQALSKNSRYIICDRDYLSALSYNYAVHKIYPEDSVFEWMVDQYCKELEGGNLLISDFYIFVDVCAKERQRRSRTDAVRDRNSLFFDADFSKHMIEFYHQVLRVLPSLWINEGDCEKNNIETLLKHAKSLDNKDKALKDLIGVLQDMRF